MTGEPAHVISFAENGRIFECEMFTLDQLPPAHIGKLYDFYIKWKKAWSGKKLPTSKDMTFEYLKGWHSNIRLVEYGENLYAPKKIKIMGEDFASYWGRGTMYDQIHSDNPPSQDTINKYYEYLEYVYNNHYSIGHGHTRAASGRFNKITWIDLPLSNNGETVTHFIAALLPQEE